MLKHLCPNCGKETKNPKFCSKTCAAQINNKLFPKRKTNRKCIVCGDVVKSYKRSRCEKHWEDYKANKFIHRTIGEYRNLNSVRGRHASWVHAHVRQFARSWNKDLLKNPCAHCGYTKHVELCHIKPLSSFKDTALLGEVNGKDNVIQLCPNCHWEFDNPEKVN